jgi:hypothetical protein
MHALSTTLQCQVGASLAKISCMQYLTSGTRAPRQLYSSLTNRKAQIQLCCALALHVSARVRDNTGLYLEVKSFNALPASCQFHCPVKNTEVSHRSHLEQLFTGYCMQALTHPLRNAILQAGRRRGQE